MAEPEQRPLAVPAARPAVEIAVVVLAVGAGLAAKALLLRAGVDTSDLLLVLPVAAVAWRSGGRLGVLATLLAIGGDITLVGPAANGAPTPADVVRITAFLFVGTTISLLAEIRLRTLRAATASEEAGRVSRAEAERALERLVGLERLLERLAPTTTPEQVADTILAHAVPTLGADAGAVVVLGPERGRARVLTAGPVAATSADLAVHERPALADVLLLGHSFWDGVPARTLPDPLDAPHALVPLRGRGPVIGALALRWRTRRSLDSAERGFAEAVASQCGQALERSLLFDAERHLRRESETSREEAVRLRDELRAVLQSIGEPILVLSPAGDVTLANRAAELLLGPMSHVDELRARMRPLDGGELDLEPGHETETRIDRTDRIVRVTAFGIHGRPSGSRVLAIRDVTELRRAEEAREVFIGVLSHELRTPVTTILGGIDLLGREIAEDDRLAVMDDMAAESERLRRLVEDVLVLSRFERGALLVEDEPVLVHHIVSSIAAQEARRSDPPAEVRLELGTDLPPVRADATYLEQILRNLIGNAVKYGGGAGPIVIRTDQREDRMEVVVADRGPGFPPEDAERLFDLFYRARRTSSKPGAGIGLFVARQLARSMGGELWARSPAGGGAEFTLSLRSFAPPDEAGPPSGEDDGIGASTGWVT